MKRFLLRLSAPLGLLVILALVLDPLFTRVFRDGRGTKAQWLMSMHGQRFDIAVIGSSRAWWNISMPQLDSACGTRSISLANNHFTPAEMLLAMKAFLRNGNSARVLLLQVDHSSLTDEQEGFSSTVYDFVPFLEDTLVYAHLAPRGDEWFWLRHVPYWRYAKYDFKWGAEQAVLTALGRRAAPFDSTGSYFSPNDKFYGKAGVPYAPVGHRMGDDLRALFALCKERGIIVIPFTTPYYELDMPAEAIGAPGRVLAVEGVRLLDYSDSLPDQRWFNDNKHLNRKGGRRFTEMLARALSSEGVCGPR